MAHPTGDGGGPRRATFFSQLWTMILRNFLLKRRALKMTIAEIAIPCLFLVIFGVLGSQLNRNYASEWDFPDPILEFDDEAFEYPSTCQAGLLEECYASNRSGQVTVPVPELFRTEYVVGCTPDTGVTREIMAKAAEYWSTLAKLAPPRYNGSVPSVLTTRFYTTEADMQQAYMDPEAVNMGVGIVFADGAVTTLSYKARFAGYTYNMIESIAKPYLTKTGGGCAPMPLQSYPGDDSFSTTPTTKATDGPEKLPTSQTCLANVHSSSGFAGLQNVLSAAYAQVKHGTADPLLMLGSKLFPIPAKKRSYFYAGDISAIMPAYLIANLFSFFINFLVVSLVTEKEKKYIASMEIMGLRPAVYWASWVVIYMTVIFVMSLICMLIAKFLFIYPLSDFFLLFLDCLLFGGSLVALGFCMASLFKRPLTAGLVTYLLILIFSGLSMLEMFVPDMPDAGRWALSILSPAAFFMTLFKVAEAEQKGFGIGWGNAMDTMQIYPASFSFGTGMIMIVVDLLAYLLLATYLEKVFPSNDGPSERAWFFLLPSYWLRSKETRSSVLHEHGSGVFDSPDIEKVPEEMRSRIALSTRGLRKVFPGAKSDAVAVDGFTYEMYEDEILAILGHNGAGKTTLINMLTGMLAPTAGNALVYGNDITHSEELEVARTMIGICPQHDVLFDTFTVREHIVFYARLKGFSSSQAIGEFERIIDQIGLRTHSDVQAQKLSGGQKRRLSIAIAVVGNPKILILDEPTSGVDPYNRHFLWDMIRGLRKGRCVIITTQSMQEADVFADRKLIISHGKLRCAGTSLFLKNRFGQGYHLTMSVERDFDEEQLESFVVSRIKGSYKARAHAGEISFVLPKSGSPDFPALFNALDSNLGKLKVRTYGVSLTTMEEIFLKLAEEEADETTGTFSSGSMEALDKEQKRREFAQLAATTFARPVRGAVPSWVKLTALCKIRLMLLLRSKSVWIFGVLIPLILVLADGGVTLINRNSSRPVDKSASANMPSLNISGVTADFVSTGKKFFYSNDAGTSDFATLSDRLQRLGGPFEPVQYSDLLQQSPHYAGYVFRGSPTANGSVKSAMVCYNSTSNLAISYTTNLLLNAVFQLNTGLDETFSVTLHPFPKRASEYDGYYYSFYLPSSFLIAMALAIIPGIYGVDVCRDRQLKIRSQIRMTGCSMWLYWGSAFLVHIVQFTVSFIMIVIVLYAFSVTAVTDAIGFFVLLFALHAPVMVLFSYCASFLFKKQETATMGLPFPLAGFGVLLYMLVTLVEVLNYNDKGRSAQGLHYAFSIGLPFYGFYGGMWAMDKVGAKNLERGRENGTQISYFEWDSNIPIIFIGHAIHIPILILLLVFVESKHFNQSWLQFFGIKSKPAPQKFLANAGAASQGPEDDDVHHERNRVEAINLQNDSSYAIVLRSLWKRFGKATAKTAKGETVLKKPAVQNISLIFPKGEIFGLLGPNGAGKSTTLSMITGEVTPSSGDIHVNGYNMHSQTMSAIETMGSCPQTDTLWEDITMEEHLKLFAILNDLPSHRSKDSIKVFSEGLHITEHMKKKAGALSGGTKRKLTFVVSMIGNPPLVLLDEPSTGMDPQSKRNLWDMIMQSFGGDRGAILTTHSMEEADALCNRIGIIVKGELQCIGSSQHLKDKFGSGYVLEVKLNMVHAIDSVEHKDMVERVKLEIGRALPGAYCTEEFYNRLVFSVPKERITSLGIVFANLDIAKQVLDLEEYSFSQTTIEQVFLHFARMQEAPEIVAAYKQTESSMTQAIPNV